jgi:hypothetical protein
MSEYAMSHEYGDYVVKALGTYQPLLGWLCFIAAWGISIGGIYYLTTGRWACAALSFTIVLGLLHLWITLVSF